jgi:hypothetical protein
VAVVKITSKNNRDFIVTLIMAAPTLQVHEEGARVFNGRLDLSQESHRFSSVHETMIVRERHVHHWLHHDLFDESLK